MAFNLRKFFKISRKKCQNYPDTHRNKAQAPFLEDLSQKQKFSEIKPPLKHDARKKSEMYQHTHFEVGIVS